MPPQNRKIVGLFAVFMCAVTTISSFSISSFSENDHLAMVKPYSVSVIIDPSIHYQTMDGWGTSLSWWANEVGGWNDTNRNAIMDLVFNQTSGLGLNTVRYNIGGGDNPACPYGTTHMRPEANMEGFEPAPGIWNWSADANQRWVLDQAKSLGAVQFEAFSNSPPYWMTNSGCTSGNTIPTMDNLKDSNYSDFADYLTEVVKHFKDEWNISFNYLEPLNEPYAPYWYAGGRQEGCHFNRSDQNRIITELSAKLKEKGLADVAVSAPDETNIDDTIDSYNSYNNSGKADVGKINTHDYQGSKRYALRDLAASEVKPLWMSEICTGDGPHDHNSITSGLALADYIYKDLKEMEVGTWVIWQAVENETDNINNNENYGLIHAFYNGSQAQTYFVTKQYYTMAQFSEFIRPGFTVIDANENNTIAAYDQNSNKLVIVIRNPGSTNLSYSFDLSKFQDLPSTSAVYRTSSTENLTRLPDQNLTGKFLNVDLPAYSLTTYELSGVDYSGSYGKFVNDNVIGNRTNQFEYNPAWSYYNAQSGAYSDDNHYSSNTNDTCKIRFNGTQIVLYAALDTVHGIAAISLDNGSENLVDLYAPTRQDQYPIYTSPILQKGNHILKVRVTGQKNASSSGTAVPIDKVYIVYGISPKIEIIHNPVIWAPESMPINISVHIVSRNNLSSAHLLYLPSTGGSWQDIILILTSGNALDGIYNVSIPGQSLGTLKYYIQATDDSGFSNSSQVFNVSIRSVNEEFGLCIVTILILIVPALFQKLRK